MLSRREVIQLIAAALGAPKRAAPAAKKGTVIGPGFYMDAHTKEKSFVLSLIDLDAPKLARREIPLDFFAHGMTPNPKHPERAVLLEKKGPGGCEVDLVAKKVLRKIQTPPERAFYGHGAYTADGSVLYIVESVLAEAHKGVITVRDGKTFEVKHLFPTYGEAPHDCRLIDGGKTLAITNGGGDVKGNVYGSVTYVDIATEHLLEKIELTSRLNAGHLAISSAGDLAVVSAPRDGVANPANVPGGVSLRRAGGRFQTMVEPAEVVTRMLGETLSVAIHEPTQIVAATNPLGHIVTFWNLKTGVYVRHLDYGNPRGIALTLDQKHFVLSFGQEPEMVMFDAETFEVVASSKFKPTAMTGSHVITYSMPA